MSRVHLLGAGSIGTLFAQHLAAAGHPTTLLLRTPASLAALQSKQYRVTVERLSEHQQPVITSSTVSAEVAATPPVLSSSSGSSGIGNSGSGSRAEVLADPGSCGPEQYDLIHHLIVTTKANHAVQALSAIKHRLSHDSVIVLLQNGVLGVYQEAVRSVFPDPDRRPAFLLGSTTHGAYSTAHFHVVHASPGTGTCVFGRPCDTLAGSACHASTEVGALASSSSSASGVHPIEQQQQLQQELPIGLQSHNRTQRQPQLQQQDRVQSMMAVLGSLQELRPAVLDPTKLHQQLLLKLLINCCANPLSALLHCRNGGLVDNTYAEHMWWQVIREFAEVFAADLDGLFNSHSNGSVTAAAGTSFGNQQLEQLEKQLFDQVRHVVDVNSSNYNSMLQSVVKHQQTEIDYINGFVMREGQAKGVPTPWNHMLWTVVKAREAVPVHLLTRELL